ncbi:MAG: class I SAM-dependent methyltransferase [Bacillota bacterium]|nr:class I SAM-dependent methyltransferase [Bacillota bacterium]
MYASLAAVYDEIQKTDFSAWADYICLLEHQYSQRSGQGDGQGGRPILLDLGCGTGGFCLEMAGRGYDPIGIDASPAMLSVARDKQKAHSGSIGAPACLFLQQDISRFELYGTVDIIVCLMDTLNHLVRKDQARRLLRLCSHYLNPGGIIIFDLASWRHLSTTLGQNLFFYDQSGYTLFWQNHFSRAKKLSTAEITLFVAEPNGRYRRNDECIRERYFDKSDIAEFIQETKLDLAAHHGDKTLARPRAADERSFYVLRRFCSH